MNTTYSVTEFSTMCPSVARHSVRCIYKTFVDQNVLLSTVKYKLYYENYAVLQSNDNCVKETTTSFYWYPELPEDNDDHDEPDTDDDSSDSFASFLLIATASLLY